MIKLSKIRQLMGRLVVVHKVSEVCSVPPAVYEFDYRPKDIDPRAGWVAGVRWYRPTKLILVVGELIEKPNGPPVPHLLVTFWPTQNAVKVPMDGWRLRRIDWDSNSMGVEPDPMPWDGQWSDAEREDMAHVAKGLERDEKGRFV